MRFPLLPDLWQCLSKAKPARQRRSATRLTVEGLEQRWLPASFTAATAAELIADINAANLTPEADTIALAAGAKFTLSAVNNSTHGPTGLPQIAAGESQTIIGSGAVLQRSSLAGVPAFRLFDVSADGSLTLQNLSLLGGLAQGQGGAVFNQGALTLESVTIQSNAAVGLDGYAGSYWAGGTGGDGQGGGIYSSGVLTISNSKIAKNSAMGGQGGAGGFYVVDATPVYTAGGDGGDGLGGGIYVAAGTASIHHSVVTGNTAKGGAGGDSYYQSGHTGQGIGGGLYIDVAAWLDLDSYSLRNCKANKASTGANNIVGVYDVIA